MKFKGFATLIALLLGAIITVIVYIVITRSLTDSAGLSEESLNPNRFQNTIDKYQQESKERQLEDVTP